jgi:chromosomal replication initiation ATPase DnaA
VQEHQNVIVTGMTGVGKTYVACALAQHACRRGFSAIYRRASRLFDELTLARADGSYARLLSRFARTDVVVIDDWGLAAAREQERHDLLEILEDRYHPGNFIGPLAFDVTLGPRAATRGDIVERRVERTVRTARYLRSCRHCRVC